VRFGPPQRTLLEWQRVSPKKLAEYLLLIRPISGNWAFPISIHQ
jgi:hypothetical protein